MEEDARRRREMTVEERLDLIERDVRSHARSLTALVKAGSSFSDEQVEQMGSVVMKALGDVGLRIDGPDHIDASREDFRFLRRLRLNWDSASRKVGGTVLLAMVGVALTIAGLGFMAWINKGR